MLTLQPGSLQAMVYGDKRPHLVAILVPDPEWAAEWAEAEGLPKEMDLLREHEKFRAAVRAAIDRVNRSEEHTSELQSLMRISYAVFCLKKKNKPSITH